jgi:hypothetical protein
MRTGWLRIIRVVLVIALAGDLVSLPLLLLQHGLVIVAQTNIGGVIDPNAPPLHLRVPHLFLDDTTISLDSRPSYGLYLLYRLENGLAYTVVTLPIILYAMRTVDDALRGDPFTVRMVRRLRNLGLMVLLGGIVAETTATLAGWALLDAALPNDGLLRDLAQPYHQTTVWWLLPGLLLLAFAAFVKRGVDLRAELDGVI